jgi:inorganic pyrophosphatase
MEHYKDLHGKKVEINGFDNKEVAIARIKECHEEYKRRNNK